MHPAPVLALGGIVCTFVDRGARGQRYTAVGDLTPTACEGEFVSVVGPIGCGGDRCPHQFSDGMRKRSSRAPTPVLRHRDFEA